MGVAFQDSVEPLAKHRVVMHVCRDLAIKTARALWVVTIITGENDVTKIVVQTV
jgi:hypothetical protein